MNIQTQNNPSFVAALWTVLVNRELCVVLIFKRISICMSEREGKSVFMVMKWEYMWKVAPLGCVTVLRSPSIDLSICS